MKRNEKNIRRENQLKVTKGKEIKENKIKR